MMSDVLRSFAHGLVESKIWLCVELEKHVSQCDNIFLFGGWSGITGLLIHARQRIAFKHVINIDIRPQVVEEAKMVLDCLNCSGKLESNVGDCNEVLVPKQVGNIVVNTSTENMSELLWFERIPAGTLVVLQGRTYYENDGCELSIKDLTEFEELFRLTTVIFKGSKQFDYSVNPYTRFMLIGFK